MGSDIPKECRKVRIGMESDFVRIPRGSLLVAETFVKYGVWCS